MQRTQETSIALMVAALLVGLLFVSTISMAAMSGGMMGGMMGGGDAGFSPLLIALVVFLGIIFLVLLVLLLSPRRETSPAGVPGPYMNKNLDVPTMQTSSEPAMAPTTIDGRASENLRAQELTIVKMLDEDERSLYTLIRERGGEMLQKDIVASKTFSKAKVTRLLDRLERKDIVVRERHGMTNKIRLVTMPPSTSEYA